MKLLASIALATGVRSQDTKKCVACNYAKDITTREEFKIIGLDEKESAEILA